MKVELSRRCECGRKEGHSDRWFYEDTEGAVGMACKSCGRLIAEWRELKHDQHRAVASLAEKYRSSDWTNFLFGSHDG